MLNINRRSYYKWFNKGKPISNNYDKETAKIISVEHLRMRKTYGTIRLKRHIENKYNGLIINHKRIRRYKHILKLEVIVRKKKGFNIIREKEKILQNKAPYKIECNFKSDRPYQKLSSDVSYIKCTDGRLYLSAVKDFFNNEIVSFSTSIYNDVKLIVESYNDLPELKNGIINTDQGAVYFSYEYIDLAQKFNFERSMSHKGHCWENCPIENWFSQLKEECLRPLGNITINQAVKEIKKYVEWYNTQRIQKKLGYLSPIEYKSQFM